MRNLPLDLRLFYYALASAEHGSFRRAAAALNIQQSSVSRGVRTLEHSVGAELFERGHTGIRPTPAGVRLLEEANLGFNHLDRAVQRVRALQRGEIGELTVGVNVPVALLGQILDSFRADFRSVSVEIVESSSIAISALIQQRKLDVAFLAKVGPPRITSPSLHLRDERLIAVLPASHSLAGERRLDLERLRAEHFILCAEGLGPDIEEYLVAHMARWDAKPRIQMHRVSQCDLVSMVAMGFGPTITIGHPQGAGTGGVASIPLTGKNLISLHAVWMEGNRNPTLEGLLSVLRGLAPPL